MGEDDHGREGGIPVSAKTKEDYKEVVARANIRHLSQLLSKTVVKVVRDGGQDEYTKECFGLEFDDGTTAWIMCDPEGNGPGHLDITKG